MNNDLNNVTIEQFNNVIGIQHEVNMKYGEALTIGGQKLRQLEIEISILNDKVNSLVLKSFSLMLMIVIQFFFVGFVLWRLK